MPSVWVPGAAADAIIAEAEGRQEAKRFLDFRNRLKAIDSRLDCFLAQRSIPDEEIRMGFYYVYRRNEDGTVAFWEIHDNGAYAEPSERVLEAFRYGDANRTDHKTDRLRQRQADERRRHKRERDHLDDLHGQFQEQIDHAFRLQVPVKKDLAA